MQRNNSLEAGLPGNLLQPPILNANSQYFWQTAPTHQTQERRRQAFNAERTGGLFGATRRKGHPRGTPCYLHFSHLLTV